MTEKRGSRPQLNFLTKTGAVLAILLFVVGAVLVLVDAVSHFTNPFASVVTYMVIPFACGLAIALAVLGWLWRALIRRIKREPLRMPVVDMNAPATRRGLVVVLFALPVVLAIAATGGYRAYHFLESVPFCGTVCHTVMEPEHTTFQNSPHAGITCASCHVGPGFTAFVKSKINGLLELRSLFLDAYDRPLKTPVHNMRPADETCGACHWREKSHGDVLRTRTHYLSDKANTQWTTIMKMKLGGGPEGGAISGAHRHVNGIRVEYVSKDDDRKVIPWIRVIRNDGSETIYRTANKDEALSDDDVATMPAREMDCTDCHNRPSHRLLTPNDAVETAMAAGRLSRALPGIKEVAGSVLAKDYGTLAEAYAKIAETMRKKYKDHVDVPQAIETIQAIYSANFFPRMKASWAAYPDHIGHKWSPGCFRCHDGKHVSAEGKPIAHGCDDCHTIVAQGPGAAPGGFSSTPLEFKHPEDIEEEWKTEACDSCHTGSP